MVKKGLSIVFINYFVKVLVFLLMRYIMNIVYKLVEFLIENQNNEQFYFLFIYICFNGFICVIDFFEFGRNVVVVGLEVVVLALVVRFKFVYYFLYFVFQFYQVFFILGFFLNQSIMFFCYFLFKLRNDWMFLLLLFIYYFYY